MREFLVMVACVMAGLVLLYFTLKKYRAVDYGDYIAP